MFGAVVQHVNDLNSKIIGSSDPAAISQPSVGIDRANEVISAAEKANNIKLGDNLAEAIDQLSKHSADLQKQLDLALEQKKSLTNDTVADIGNTTTQMTKLQQELDETNKKLQEAQAEGQKAHEAYMAQLEKDHQAMDTERQKTLEALNEARQRETDLNQNLAVANKTRDQAVHEAQRPALPSRRSDGGPGGRKHHVRGA